jgi:16S rRNA (adenine1518-N6/adenine1519-N6)-dimethyltransferase
VKPKKPTGLPKKISSRTGNALPEKGRGPKKGQPGSGRPAPGKPGKPARPGTKRPRPELALEGVSELGAAEAAPQPAAPALPRHRAKKRLGQNFLRDMTVIDQIVEAAELSAGDQVLEIGPGQGVLTSALAQAGAKVVAVELDQSLKPFLEPIEAGHPAVSVVYQDFMKTDWNALPFEAGKPVKVVANIPYYITTPILLKLLQAERVEREPLSAITPLAERILLMVQWEVARRMTAGPGSKEFGSLSLIAQYAAEVSIVTKVPKGAFRPIPEVDSAVVMLKPRSVAPVQVKDARTLFRIVRGVFQQRRKTLQNGLLAAGFTKAQLESAASALALDLGRRAETLSLEEFAALANALSA